MAELTKNEKAYKYLIEKIKTEMPLRDVSVFQQPLITREDLLNTIYHKLSPIFLGKRTFLSPFRLASELFSIDGSLYKKNTSVFPDPNTLKFRNMKTIEQVSDTLCETIVKAYPTVKLPVLTFDFQENKSNLQRFIRHYEASIELLLEGPPHAGQHTINEELANEWVNRQKTPERRRLARLFVENLIYISHLELLETIKMCIKEVKTKLVEGPVTFIVGTEKKSNYYVSLLFYHYWRQAGLPLDNVKSHMDTLIPGNLIDIDEMAYSGSQTVLTLSNVYGMLLSQIKQSMDSLNSDNIDYKHIINFLPIPIAELVLQKAGVNYIVARMFCSEDGRKQLLKMPPGTGSTKNNVKPPFSLIIGRIIPSLATVFGEDDADKLSILFGPAPENPAASIYFNHKVADVVSTFLNPITFGVIPTRVMVNTEGNIKQKHLKYLKNLEVAPHNTSLYEVTNPNQRVNELDLHLVNDDVGEFLPFIHHCGPEDRPMPTSWSNLKNYRPPGNTSTHFSPRQIPDDFRCPFAWYKYIDYDTGTYPSIPLPHGPTSENFVGGKRKTRRQQRRVKRKTRSHSK